MNTNENQMFCRQCQETIGNVGCTRVGACGKRPETARMMDELIAALEEIAATHEPTQGLGRFAARALFMTLTNANFDEERFKEMLDASELILRHTPTRKVPSPFLENDPDVRSLKELTLFGLKGIAAYCHHAAVLGKEDGAIYGFIQWALKSLGERKSFMALIRLVQECGQHAVRAMALLDTANTGAFGHPEITSVRLDVGNRPGILVSGHDLRDLKELLDQTKGRGVDVYTHGEMLPAHSYPAFRNYPHLRGNYGGAWYSQQRDFTAFNGAILMTTNCIVPVASAYQDRIFTTGVAGYPGVPHIPDHVGRRPKDFAIVIDRALRCAPPKELEKGTVTGGFAHAQVLALKDRIVDAVNAGKIRRFVVMAGCDGRHATRAYYTQVAKKLPPDAVILTAGCAKYRYLKLGLGEIDGIPRVLDAGQCNDSYSLAVIALALKDAYHLKDVNSLPIAFDIAWYEQKAVAVLLALLSLGFKNIRLGPTLPAFLSPHVVKVLSDHFGLKPIGNVDDDVLSMME